MKTKLLAYSRKLFYGQWTVGIEIDGCPLYFDVLVNEATKDADVQVNVKNNILSQELLHKINSWNVSTTLGAEVTCMLEKVGELKVADDGTYSCAISKEAW